MITAACISKGLIFGPFLLWPNGWMHQDATWYGSICFSRGDFVLDGDPAPTPKGAEPPIFGPRLLWPKGCVEQDAAWYGSRPGPRPHRIRRGPSSHKRCTAAPQPPPPLFGPCLLWPRSFISATAELLLSFAVTGFSVVL